MSRKKNNYVDDKRLHQAMVVYKEEIRKAQARGETRKPPVPEYVGIAIMLIANNLSKRPNFRNYSYIDEMVADGIENCLRYCHNFKPELYDSPFTYFTTIIFQAFVRRLKKEQKQAEIKEKMFENSMMFDLLVHQSDENPLTLNGGSVQSDRNYGATDFEPTPVKSSSVPQLKKKTRRKD